MHSNSIALINGKIRTMDARETIAEAVVAEEGKIVYVGTTKAAKDRIRDDMEVIDLEGKTVLPGLIEPHVHIPGNAYNALFNMNLFDAKTEEETMKEIEQFIRKHPEQEMYFGRGFMSSVFPGLESSLGPKKERLDALCSDKPIVIIDFGGHVVWQNTEAFRRFGITKETPEIPGGIIEKDPETGELWGTLKEEAKCLHPDQEFTLEEKKDAVRWLQNQMNAYGYTSVFALRPSACSDPRPIYDALKEMEDRGELTMRYVGAREIKANLPKQEQIKEAAHFTHVYKSDLLRAKTAKFFIDGTVEGVSAYLSEPYLPEAGKGSDYVGEPLWKKEELADAFINVLSEGMNIHVHAIGDAAVTQAIDALEIAQKAVPGDHRNCITHLQIVKPSDIKRMADLNIVACCNVHWHFKDPSIYFECELPFLGEKRAENEYPLASLLKEGITITASGDVPITAYPNPFFAIECGVTRNLINAKFFKEEPIEDKDDPKWLLNKDERVSVLDMLKMYTVNAAYALHIDDITGSIEPGKYGDMIVIDRDVCEVDPLDIENTRVLKTILAGNVIYNAEDD